MELQDINVHDGVEPKVEKNVEGANNDTNVGERPMDTKETINSQAIGNGGEQSRQTTTKDERGVMKVEGAKAGKGEKRKKKSTTRLKNKWSYFLTILGLSISFLYYGYQLVAFGVVLNTLTTVMNWSDSQKNFYLILISCMVSGGNFIGSVLSPPLSHWIGRFKTILLMVILAYIGSILSAIATVPTLIIGRLLANIPAGVFITIAPVIGREISPKELHWFSSAFIPYFAGFGIFIGFIIARGGPNMSQADNQYWRFLNLFGIIPATITGLILIFNTRGDSGKFLYNRYEDEEGARKALARVYKKEEVERELEDIKKDSHAQEEKFSVSNLYRNYRKQIYLGLALGLSQVCAGLNYSGIYAYMMIERTERDAGAEKSSIKDTALLFTSFYGIAQVVGNTGSFFWLGKCRKKWLFAIIFGLSYLALGLNWLFGFVGLYTAQKYCLILTFFCSGAGIGQFNFLYSPNIMTGTAFSVVIGGFSFMRVIDTIVFPIIAGSAVKVRGTLLIYWAIGMVTSAYFLLKSVEIKGASKEDIYKHFNINAEETRVEEKAEMRIIKKILQRTMRR